ncbi:MAG: MotA/TolQ/ExbB proton channel family protein [Alphaproteobacteria bacterium]|nr:MotA/TolQ/ExbB proton channel family protein [Alphaproteobacteria bacterium]
MASDVQQQADATLPNVTVPGVRNVMDLVTLLGLILSFALIIGAISMGQSDANFVNGPSVMIVIFGTMTASCIPYTGMELRQSLSILFTSFLRPVRSFSQLATSLIDLAVIARKKGLLSMANYENQTKNEPFLLYTLGLVTDGYNYEDIRRILELDIEKEEERMKRAASILKRASEVAPAMGLIGTLVGLVQMLAELENPEAIGPAMALALLTTFYGAIMGTVVLSPLAAKVEKNAADQAMAKTMILKTALSMIKQENPRNLEMIINGLLPPSLRINYFK